MSCPYLKEIAMLYCGAFPIRKMLPKDRMTTACMCTGQDFQSCPFFEEVVKRVREQLEAEQRGAAEPTPTPPASKEDKP
ncbi:MAG TPA: hypothetical protein VGQ83_31335 [Polyangia bacterium]|jgi:hypothetical protein